MATNPMAQPGIIARDGVGHDLLDKTLDQMRVRYNKVPLQGSRFVRTEKARGGTYKENTYSSEVELPPLSEDTSDLRFVTPAKGFARQGTILTYRLAIQTERSMVEDELFGVVKRMMSGLLDSGKQLIEYGIADIMNNLTTNSAAYQGADGVPLAYATHPRPVARAGTWNNVEVPGSLSLTTFTIARANMQRRGASDFGYVMPIYPALMVVPPELEKAARDLKHAEKNPANALNEPNTFRQDPWEPVVYNYFSSATNWVLFGDMPEMYRGIVYAATQQPSVTSLMGKDISVDVLWGSRLRARILFMPVDGLNMQYSAGA